MTGKRACESLTAAGVSGVQTAKGPATLSAPRLKAQRGRLARMHSCGAAVSHCLLEMPLGRSAHRAGACGCAFPFGACQGPASQPWSAHWHRRRAVPCSLQRFAGRLLVAPHAFRRAQSASSRASRIQPPRCRVAHLTGLCILKGYVTQGIKGDAAPWSVMLGLGSGINANCVFHSCYLQHAPHPCPRFNTCKTCVGVLAACFSRPWPSAALWLGVLASCI